MASAGGGSSGGGGGEAIGIFGYAAGYYPTKWLKKKKLLPLGIIISSILVVLITVIFITFSFFLAIITLVAGVVGIYTAASGVFAKWKDRAKKAEGKIAVAAQADPTWQPQEVINTTSQLFAQFQHDWGRMDLNAMQRYLTPTYYPHVQLMLYAFTQMNRINTTTDIKFDEAPLIVDVTDVAGRSGDRVVVAFSASANDQLIDTTNNSVIFKTKEPIVEAWHFIRNDDQWQLEAIEPAAANLQAEDANMKQFAASNKMYYSGNWGRFLLPRGGELFGKATFTNSLITNHIIGMWEGNLLVQLYRYGTPNATYEVGQITLPKTYGGIIIKRRQGFSVSKDIFARKPKGYEKVSLEWGDFNKRYDVYATDMERVTTFELLNPAFMAWLYDQNIQVNIEVIENVVYIYGQSLKAQRYDTMMEILKKAHKELKR